MNVTTELLRIVQQAHSVSRMLEAAVSVMREWFRADTCAAFLLDDAGELVLRASAFSSASIQFDAPEAARIAAEAIALHRVLTQQGASGTLVAAPMRFRDTALGALVVENRGARVLTVPDDGDLASMCAHLAGVVENTRLVAALDRGESPLPRVVPRAAAKDVTGECTRRGVAASPGVASGKAVSRRHRPLTPDGRSVADVEPHAERAHARIAFEKTRNDVLRVQSAVARELDEEHALIFAAHLLLLRDPMLLANIERRIVAGSTAGLAIDGAFREFENRLSAVADA